MKTNRKLIAKSQVLWVVVGRQTPDAELLACSVHTTYEAAANYCTFQMKLWPEGYFSVHASNFHG